jgi:hypothetical protein
MARGLGVQRDELHFIVPETGRPKAALAQQADSRSTAATANMRNSNG